MESAEALREVNSMRLRPVHDDKPLRTIITQVTGS